MGKLDTFIKINVDGNAAVRELGQVEKAAKDVDTELDDVSQPGRFDGLAGGLAKVAGPAAIGAVAGGLFKMADGFANVAIEAGTMSSALDISVEDASRLNAAFSAVGLEMNDTVDIALQIGQAVADDADLATALGLEVGKAVDPVEALRAGVDRWDFLTPSQRAKAFGEEGVRQIARLTSEGRTLDEILAEVNPGQIIDEEELRKAQEFKETTAEIKALWEGVVITIGGPLAGAIAEAADPENWKGIIGGGEDASDTMTRLWGEVETLRDKELEAAAAADEMGDEVVDAGKEGTDAVRNVASEYDRLTGKLNNRTSWLNLQDTIDTVKDKGIAAFAAGAEGADDAERKVRDYERAQIDLQSKVLDYLTTVLEIPEEVATDIALGYAGLTPDQVEEQLAALTRRRTIELRFQEVGPPRYAGVPIGPRASSVTNVTINPSRTMGPREIALMGQEWSRFNG